MTTTVGSELEVTPNYPPDWRDWINEFPSVKAAALFVVVAWIVTALVIGVAALWGYYTDHDPTAGILGVLDRWLDALNWLTAAVLFGVVGKRATEKPEIIAAEAQAKAAQVAAAQGNTPAAIPTTYPTTTPLVPPLTDLAEIAGEGD